MNIKDLRIIQKINLSYILGGLIFIYLILRVAMVPVSDDEFMTIEMHSSLGIQDILITGQPSLDWAANNHILNTLFVKLEMYVFGWKDWAIRLHILIAFIFGYLYCYKLFKIFVQSEVRICLFLLIVFLNPYILDFYGIARGYALSISAFIAALYYLFTFLDNKSIKSFNLLYFCLFISIWSNFSALYLLLAVNIIILFENRNEISDIKIRRYLLLSVAYSCLIGVIIIFPILKTLSSPIVYGGNTGIFQDMIVNYISLYIHHNPKIDRHLQITQDWKLIEILGIVFFLLWVALISFSLTFEANKKIKVAQNVFLFFILIVVFFSKFLFIFNQTPYPTGRTQLLFSIPFYMGICIAFERIILHRKRFIVTLYLVIILLLTHFFYSLNFVNTIDWWQNGDAKEIANFMKNEIKTNKNKQLKTLGAENWQYHSLAFYIKGQFQNSLEIIWTDLSDKNRYDYLLVPHHRKSEVPQNYDQIKEFGKTTLYKHINDLEH